MAIRSFSRFMALHSMNNIDKQGAIVPPEVASNKLLEASMTLPGPKHSALFVSCGPP